MKPEKALQKLRAIDREKQLMVHTAALLQWDQETGMPPKAIGERSEQIALLEGFVHDRLTSREVADLLGDAGFTDSAGIHLSNNGEKTGDKNDDKAFLRAFGRGYE
ncbi:MAG: carboxypeptidase M32, partial [Sediminispirochaetaceae bacterium]